MNTTMIFGVGALFGAFTMLSFTTIYWRRILKHCLRVQHEELTKRFKKEHCVCAKEK